MRIGPNALLVAALLMPDWSGAQSTAPPAPDTQQSVQKMQQQMDEIVASKDPQVRQKLLQEHMQTMQQAMKAMRGTADPAAKAQGQHGGMPMRGKSGGMASADEMKARQDTMEKRMDTMMMMMEQMMKRDQMQSAPMGHM